MQALNFQPNEAARILAIHKKLKRIGNGANTSTPA
jgi:hypothetical protein